MDGVEDALDEFGVQPVCGGGSGSGVLSAGNASAGTPEDDAYVIGSVVGAPPARPMNAPMEGPPQTGPEREPARDPAFEALLERARARMKEAP